MQTPSNSPFDSRALLAVAIVAIFYLGWQKYLNTKYPKAPAVTTTTNTAQGTVSTTTASADGSISASSPVTSGISAAPVAAQESFVDFENQNISLKISNKGMGFSEVNLKKFIDKEEKLVKVSEGTLYHLFALRLDNNDVFFNISKKDENTFLGVYENADYRLERDLIFTESYHLNSNVRVTSKTGKIPKISVLIADKIKVTESGSWFFPSYDHQDFHVVDNKETHLVNFSNSKENITQDFNPVTVAGISSQYFTATLLDKSPIMPAAHVKSTVDSEALVDLEYQPTQKNDLYTFSQVIFMGPKLLDELKLVDPQLGEVVNFGMLGWLARPMLGVMKVFFQWTSNWGFAIILLTLLVRLLVLPFNIVSARSMKAMQKIQPLIAELRERYKDDPMTLNKEMMGLMKQNKANPLSGCLPMLLQIPVFFALFRVIGSSVELYRSPFIWWIHDLSFRDPLYVLPVIMGITMFIQQKMTPTTMDATQAKILMYLPLIFTVFMLNLPSGLTLYMCVSAIFGIVQQWFILKKSKV